MILAFQILLFIVILLFSMAAISEQRKEANLHYSCIAISGILAVCFTLWLGVN
ncbi:MAG: hypothetical protein LPK00_13190 [Bacillaceae bacterium]|nr:hypothetical protein [Bacillaceae bacterium]